MIAWRSTRQVRFIGNWVRCIDKALNGNSPTLVLDRWQIVVRPKTVGSCR